ncbi:MAG TPA: hypothetical protein VMU51_38865 [Mycobacteriales bacterium]|nr:hypothetical protein [Mycobacteriales bacterium]
MTPADPQPSDPIDETDLAILDGVRTLYSAVDPVPADLLTCIGFALSLENMDADSFRPDRAEDLVATRGADDGSRTITFHNDHLTVLVSVARQPDSTFTIDGWLTPPGTHSVQVRTTDGPTRTVADEQGRFVFTDIPAGVVQFVVRPVGAGGPIVTPAVVL